MMEGGVDGLMSASERADEVEAENREPPEPPRQAYARGCPR